MNKNGQTMGIGAFVMLAIVILVGVILLQASAQEVGKASNLVNIDVNITAPANGGVYNFTDYKSLGTVTITNASNSNPITDGNYTLAESQLLNGVLVATLTVDDAELAGESWNIVSSTGQTPEYISNGGARSMASLIIIMMALALAIVIISSAVKKEYFS